jgi:peroxiredoxin
LIVTVEMLDQSPVEARRRVEVFVESCLIEFMRSGVGAMNGILFLTLATLLSADSPAADSPLGRGVEAFSGQDFRGKQIELSDYRDKKIVVVAFLGVECPLAKLYAPKLAELAERYRESGVQFIGVDSNQQDAVTEIGFFVQQLGVSFPVIKDVGNVIADQFSAERTPEVFVLDQKRVIRYVGRVDDQYGFKTNGGYAQNKAKSHELISAIDELLAGKEVTTRLARADGCKIGRVRQPDPAAKVTYTKDVASILQERCVVCHRPGEIGPFALQSYEEAQGWAEMIEEVVRDQRMPPWHANPAHGDWSNDGRLSDKEKSIIHDWVAAGAPMGDPKDMPAPKSYVSGWQIGKPDQIVYMSDKEFDVAAEGTIDYQYFTVDPGFKEDKWIKGVECRPGNRSVVHHIIVFVQPPGVQPQMFEGGPANLSLLQGEAPGMPPTMLPDGLAFFVPAGSKFVFQMHYTANGKPGKDRSCVGLVFADAKDVKQEARTMNAGDPFFEIPPHADNHPVNAEFKFWADAKLISLMPHMHVRGKSFRYTLVYPDGKSEILLDVPRYDFNWQNMYWFREAKNVPMGSVLQCVAHFDNSEGNPANPDPSASVRWGEQTWEEMMLGWFVCTMDTESSEGRKRTEAFLANVKKAPLAADLNLNMAALGAMKSDRDFRRFSRSLAAMIPQIDRVCISKLSGENVEFVRLSQPPILNSKIGGTDYVVPAPSSGLAMYLLDPKLVVNGNLKSVPGEDMARMSLVMKSSLHIPAKIAGQQVVVSFWSREENAFPPECLGFLKSMTERAMKNAKMPVRGVASEAAEVSER